MIPTPEDIDRALRLGEDSHNEFKSVRRGPLEPKDIAKAVVAFANAGGGRIWFGVEPDGSVSGAGGLAERDALQLRIDEACATGVVPPLTCTHRRTEHGGVVLIVTEVPAFAPGRPFRTADGRHYVRQGASARLATPEEQRSLTLSAAASGMVPDEAPVPGTSVEDLDDAKFREFHRTVWDTLPPDDPAERGRLLRNLRIACGDGSLSLMGVLCFAKDPQARFLLAYVTCARELGTTLGGGPMADRKDFRGTLERQIRDAEDWIDAVLPAPSEVREFESERPEPVLPRVAVREIVRNAVAHRDYSVPGQILVTVFDDRLEVVSPGRLLNSLSVDAIRTGAVHVERNPLVCSVLARWGMMTERGTGVLRATAAMRRRGLPDPEFDVRGPSFAVTLRWRARA